MKRIITYATLFIFALQVKAQVTNNGNLQIHAGATVAGLGNFTNTSSGVLVNNGTLYLKANISNDQASMAVGTGTLHLDGSSAQTISGSQTFRTYNLVTNNAAGIIVNNNLSISNTHTFSAGVITTSATPNYLVYEAGASYSGDNDSRHVNGWVKKTGNTNFIFPVGNGSMERTVALTSLSESSEFNVRYVTPAPNTSQLVIPVLSIQPSEAWIVNRVSGGSASVNMNWDHNKVQFPYWMVPEILVTRYTGANWVDAGGAGTASGSVTATGTITSASTSSFGHFTFGSMAYAVPSKLLSFAAKRANNYTEITWQAANEYNLAYYTVERSDDNIHFYPVEQVAGRNIAGTQHYLAKDHKAINNAAFYRLRSIDTDKKEALSKVVVVTDSQINSLTLLTNPVHDKISLMADGNISGLYNYTINSIGGQLVQRGTLVMQGAGKYELKLDKYPAPGTYSLVIKNADHIYTFKFIVK